MLQTDQIIEANENFLDDFGADLQANIFSPHRRDHVLLLFLNFKGKEEGDLDDILRFLSSLARNSETRQGLYLTSTRNQEDLSEKEKSPNVAAALFCNLYLTANGLELLGDKGGSWKEIISELKHNNGDLNADTNWDQKPVQTEIHAMMLLAHPKKRTLVNRLTDLRTRFFKPLGIVECLDKEWGTAFRRRVFPTQRRGFTLEHFGYVDGLSHPWITWKDRLIRGNKNSRRLIKVNSHWDPTCSVQDFLIPEPTKSGTKSYGSYLVFRKLEQDVAKFEKAVKDLSEISGLSIGEAGALAIGRQADGTPLEPATKDELNDFQFGLEGKCPAFAHIRKMNRRDDPPGDKHLKKLKNAILRRGITYGDRTINYGKFAPLEEGAEVGILFMSFQKDISYYQQLLVDAQGEEDGADPLIGGLNDSKKKFKHTIKSKGEKSLTHSGFGGFVNMKGGLNLYAPSLQFFKKLDKQWEVTREEDSVDFTPQITLENISKLTSDNMNTANFPIFGDDLFSFLGVVNHYNSRKVGYDSSIINYGMGNTGYDTELPTNLGPSVPIRDKKQMEEIMNIFQDESEIENTPLGFELYVPIPKGYQAKVRATLSNWDGSEILAAYNSHEDPQNKFFFNGPTDLSTGLLTTDGPAVDDYGFLRVVLFKNDTDSGSLSPDNFLQKKIVNSINQGTPVTNRLFVLRVWQIVWLKDKSIEMVTSEEFECRDDSIVLEILV